jgi:DNA invertase Pin-like site-specific DNA recombinase
MRDIEGINIEFVRHYHDTSSGSSFDRRPQYTEMMAKAGTEWNLVLFYHIDRLHRDMKNQILWLDDLRAAECDFLDLTNPHLNSTGPSGELIFHIMASFAEYERKQTAKKVKMGLEGARRAGRWIGTPPLGYKMDDTYNAHGVRKHVGILIPYSVESQSVHFILGHHAQGRGVSQIITDLIEKRLYTRSEGLVWNRSTIKAVIGRCELYIAGAKQLVPGFPQDTWAALDQKPIYTISENTGIPVLADSDQFGVTINSALSSRKYDGSNTFEMYQIVASLLEISQDGGSSWETLTHPQQINDNSLVRRTIATDEEE